MRTAEAGCREEHSLHGLSRLDFGQSPVDVRAEHDDEWIGFVLLARFAFHRVAGGKVPQHPFVLWFRLRTSGPLWNAVRARPGGQFGLDIRVGQVKAVCAQDEFL